MRFRREVHGPIRPKVNIISGSSEATLIQSGMELTYRPSRS